MLLTFILLPLVSLSFYSSPMVLGQEKQQNYAVKDILICQMKEYIESPIGASMLQESNICSYQNAIGYNQFLAELCFIFSGRNIDIINAFCDKVNPDPVYTPVVNETSTQPVVNETNDILNGQNNTSNPASFTLFDGVSNFFSNLFNP